MISGRFQSKLNFWCGGGDLMFLVRWKSIFEPTLFRFGILEEQLLFLQVIVRCCWFFRGIMRYFWYGNVFIQHITSTEILRFDQTVRDIIQKSLKTFLEDRKISFCKRSSKTLVRTSGRTQFRWFWTKCLENLIGLVNVYIPSRWHYQKIYF